jgi:hypothetical protein
MLSTACNGKSNAAQGEQTQVKLVSKELTERAAAALSAIGKLTDAKAKTLLMDEYKKLDNAIVSRNSEDVKNLLDAIEPKIEEASKASDPTMPTNDQILAKSKEIDAALAKLTDGITKKTIVDLYNEAKTVFSKGDLVKAWEMELVIETKLKEALAAEPQTTVKQDDNTAGPTKDEVLKKADEVKTAAAALTDEQLKKTVTEKYETAVNAFKAGDLKTAMDILLEIEQAIKK